MTETTGAPVTEAGYERGIFRGNAREYFGIWIVNVLLTIVTVGIYSAWAKVRRKRYFYGNTELAGRTFDYHARGLQIFIGRLIALAFIVVVNMLGYVNPILALAGSLLFIVILPWLVMRSLRFNARVTSYRNVRFDFVGGVGGAFVAIVLGSLVALVSLGILAPFASRWLNRYVFDNLRYGDRAFATDPRIGALYRVWILPVLLMVLGVVLIALVSIPAFLLASDDDAAMTIWIGLVYASVFGTLIVFAIVGLLYQIGVRNVVWSATVLDGRHRLGSDMSRFRYLWIMVSNLVVTVLTLGLMRPWAAVREARYIVEHSGIRFDGELGEIFSSIERTGGAASAEYLDMEGFDFGF
ncbi:DUF898 family protein [Rhizobiaceae bacterium BDR2-2]|uniref:DUF898 family protein n=1 Tax=Ectorhizobium quercum TaxID=2965071 RepID=A0AAE3SVX6_9HYPH|nr:DUF898 family protein [Ectorhizobium quercum]MCX8996166.1 DUF898 family protein [Ectorhizobium quercum]MCX8998795.1 DUF898 family protein [Ectorhizobium quercum]